MIKFISPISLSFWESGNLTSCCITYMLHVFLSCASSMRWRWKLPCEYWIFRKIDKGCKFDLLRIYLLFPRGLNIWKKEFNSQIGSFIFLCLGRIGLEIICKLETQGMAYKSNILGSILILGITRLRGFSRGALMRNSLLRACALNPLPHG